jgi:hypothetical protein|nr:MAG TPA: hypothetical protein [Caudoviricetes sp.]
MSNYGIETADITIDAKYRGYVLKAVHNLTQNCTGEHDYGYYKEYDYDGHYVIDGAPDDVYVVTDLTHNDQLNLNHNQGLRGVTLSYADNGAAVFNFCPPVVGTKAKLTVYQYTLAHKSVENYGIEVYDEHGNVVFNSSEKPLLIFDSIRLGNQSQVIRKYNKRVGIIATPLNTIMGQTFGVYQELPQCLKANDSTTVAYSCWTSVEVDGEYFGNSVLAVPFSENYHTMLVADLSNV